MGSVRGARGDFVDSLGVLLSQGVRKRRRICWAGQIFGERLAQPRVDESTLHAPPTQAMARPLYWMYALVEVLVSMTHRSKIGRVLKHFLTDRVTVCG